MKNGFVSVREVDTPPTDKMATYYIIYEHDEKDDIPEVFMYACLGSVVMGMASLILLCAVSSP